MGVGWVENYILDVLIGAGSSTVIYTNAIWTELRVQEKESVGIRGD